MPLSPRRVRARSVRHVLPLFLLVLTVATPATAAEEAARPGVAVKDSKATGPGAAAGEAAMAPPTAAGLLARFERRLGTAPGAGDIAALVNERERLRAAGLPRLRLSERSSWNFGELVELGFGASLSWALSDPANAAQEELLAQRLELARHNARSRRASQLAEFRRTLRLLAHLEQVEALLSRHRDRLLALRPDWRELMQYLVSASEPTAGSGLVASGGEGSISSAERVGFLEVAPSAERVGFLEVPPSAERVGFLEVAPSAEQVGFLEVVQALERTRRERSLLLLAVSDRAGVDVRDLKGVVLGTPPLADPAKVTETCLAPGAVENAETVRAALLLEESRLAARADAARAQPKVSLDLSGNARYSNSALSRDPWNADLRLALRVAVPAGAGVGTEISAAVTPAGLAQELSISWPPVAEVTGTGTAVAQKGYRRALSEARYSALSRVKALRDALDNLRLRRVELTAARSAATTAVASFGLLNEAAQAELALLNAELEVDLALIEAAAGCS